MFLRFSSERVKREEYLYPPIEYNVITSKIMDYKLCIVTLDKGGSLFYLIGFVHLHRVICLIHVYIQHTQLGKEGL